MKITLHPGEQQLGTWTLFYLPPDGGKYNGTLTVTDQRLLYDAKFDATFRGIVAEAVFIKWGSEGYLEIPKTAITAVDVEKRMLSKRCIVTLGDGTRHTFDYGALNVDKVAAAVRT